MDTAYFLLYVDDIVLTASSHALLQQIITSLHKGFVMTDFLNYFMDISVTRDSSGIFLSQKKYLVEILEMAHIVNCSPIRTPESELGIDGDPVSDLTLYQSLAAGSETRPPMLNKENCVPWSYRLFRYAKSRPNGKLIHNSILNGPYVRKMIPEPGDANRDITVTETFHLQTDEELSDKELKQIKADDQAIQTILLGLPEDIYAAVDSCETAQEIWLRVQKMMKGSDTGIQEKKAKLFNEWERFTSNKGESIESYYHRFLKLMNDLKRNKHFPEKIASNLKFLNNLQPEWSRHVTIVHQTKNLHTADYTQLSDFLKYNQKEVDELKAERIAKTQYPLALMANSNNPYVFLEPHQDQSSFNQNYLQQPMPNPEDITDPTTAMNMAVCRAECKEFG
nr:ribonuclease H-like domain-containing protein [Tanacetum cinerariifolium]